MGLLKRRQEVEMMQQQDRPEDEIHRQAAALEKVTKIHADNVTMRDKIEQDRRTIERLEDRCTFLLSELDKAQQDAKLYQRKMIRLAAAMSGMSRLAADADAIMRDYRDLEELENQKHQANDEEVGMTAEAIVASLPPRQDQE